MNAKAWASAVIAAMTFTGSVALAQVPADLAEKLRAIGPVINPPATAPLYAPRVIESEPYANVTVTRDLRYGPADRNLLDVFVPTEASAQPRPVLIFVHGGGFVAGNRRAPGSPFYDNVMLWAVRNDMVGVNMTYRLAPQSPWPAGAEDVGLGVKWVHEQIAAHGGDPKRVYILGHSAGAIHVADYLANERFQVVGGSGLAGAMLLSGLYEVTPETAVPAYYGTDASRYAEQSSLNGLLRTRVPLWVGSAELDPPAFVAQAARLTEALCQASRCPAAAKFAGHSHLSEAYSIHTDDRSVSGGLAKFLPRSSAPRTWVP